MADTRQFTIPWETADSIALAVMKEHREYLVEELRKHDEEGSWMHPEDVEHSRQHLIPSLDCLINHFGG